MAQFPGGSLVVGTALREVGGRSVFVDVRLVPAAVVQHAADRALAALETRQQSIGATGDCERAGLGPAHREYTDERASVKPQPPSSDPP